MSGLLTAEQAVRLAQSDPEQARALALAALMDAPDDLTTVVAERALGLAAKAQQDWPEAQRHLERSIATAVTSCLAPAVAAETRASLAPVLWYLGDTTAALAQIEMAAPALTGAVAARLDLNRAFIMQREGRLDEALQIYRRILAVMRRLGAVADEASVLTNRALLHAYRGHFRSAEADLHQAQRLHVRLGQKLQAADVRHNLGFIAARRGDIPTALKLYDAAERERAALGVSTPQALVDRTEALLTVRLVGEARRVGELAASRLAAAGLEPELAEARLLLAQAAQLDGDIAESRRMAELARSSFECQNRRGWLALANYAVLRADHLEKRMPPENLRQAALRTAEALGEAGWAVQALDARIIAAQVALAAGAVGTAAEDLGGSSGARLWGPADLRAKAWYAEALLRHARHDHRGARTALMAGMKALSDGRATLGATELRVHAAAQGQEILELGTRLALASRRAEQVLAWTERCRAMTALRRRPPRPPSDRHVASLLERLRHIVSQVEEAGLTGADTKRLLRSQGMLEAEIRRRTRHALADGRDADAPAPIELLKGALGDAVLVELIESDDRLYAVTLNRRRVRLHVLGPTKDVAAQMATLRFALGRLATGRATTASAGAARQLAEEMAAELDRQLLVPLRRETRDAPLVLVPTGVLHAMPWGVLPSCRGRAVTVSPSATLWLDGLWPVVEADPKAKTLLVAGPGLVHAPAEIEDLFQVYPQAEVLVGSKATSARFTRAAGAADLIHIAAHGDFRDDNPLMSSLRLADGPMTVYDFEGLASPPRCVVLSACEAGLSAVRPGEELMGLSAALLGAGSGVLIASVIPARDVTCRSLMVGFHRRLTRGISPALALAESQDAAHRDDTDSALSAAGFVCFGAGLQRM